MLQRILGRFRLNSIKARIILSMALSTISVGALIGGISLWRSTAFIQDEVLRNLQLTTEAQAAQLDAILLRVETAAQALADYTSATMPTPSPHASGALLAYQDQAAPVLQRVITNVPSAMAVYYYTSLALSKGVYGAWYVDENHGKGATRFVRNLDMGKMSDFVASDPAMSYYFDPLRLKRGVWSSPYEDKDLKISMVTYSLPVMRQGRPIGIVGIDLSFDNLVNLVKNIRIYGTGQAILVDSNGVIVAARTFKIGDELSKVAGGAYADVARLIQREKEGLTEMTLDGHAQMVNFTRLNSGYRLLTQLDKDDAFAKTSALVYIIGALVLVCLAISVFLAIGVGIRLSSPTQRMIGHIQRLARYDLTLQIPTDASQSEIGELSRSVQQFTGQLRQAFTNMQGNAASLSGAAEALLQSSGALRSNADGVSQLSTDASRSTEQLTRDLKAIANSARESSEEIREALASSEFVRQRAQAMDGDVQTLSGALTDVAASSQEMSEIVSSVAAAVEEIHASLGDVSGSAEQGMAIVSSAREDAQATAVVVEDLSQTVASIDQVVTLIGDVARKTHLLALNASIEASRAGEHGRGFAVVANEVKSLAGQSADAAHEIQDRIAAVQRVSEQAMATLGQIVHRVDEACVANERIASAVEQQGLTASEVSRSVSRAAQLAGQVSARVQDTSSAMQRLAGDTRQTSERIQGMTSSMGMVLEGAGRICQTSQQAATEAEKVSGRISEVSRSARESSGDASSVATTSQDLERLSRQISEMAGQFKV